MQVQMKQISGLLSALKTPFVVSDTPPTDISENQVWLDTTTVTLYIYMQTANGLVWVEIY